MRVGHLLLAVAMALGAAGCGEVGPPFGPAASPTEPPWVVDAVQAHRGLLDIGLVCGGATRAAGAEKISTTCQVEPEHGAVGRVELVSGPAGLERVQAVLDDVPDDATDERLRVFASILGGLPALGGSTPFLAQWVEAHPGGGTETIGPWRIDLNARASTRRLSVVRDG